MRKTRNYEQTELFSQLLKESEIQNSVLDYLVNMGFVAIRVNSGVFIQGSNRFIRSYIIHNFKKKFWALLSKFFFGDGREKPKISKGFPDVLALRGNNFFLFEIKAGSGGRLSESQKDFIELAKSKNIQVHIIDNLDQVIKIIEDSN